jgi:hypothetical protein
MNPLWWPFQWPSRCGSTIPRASPDGGGSGLSYKPLNAAIGQAHGVAVIAMLLFGLMFEVWLRFCREVATFT